MIRRLPFLGAIAAFVVLAAAPGASGSAPPLPAGCNGGSFGFQSTATQPVSGGVGATPVTSTIVVSGASGYLLDVDMLAAVSHSFPADLDVTLTSPEGTTSTITTDNGGSNDDVFGNAATDVRWDDDGSGGPVTDALLLPGIPSPQPLVPEEAMGAFVGENPNGTWILTVADDAAPADGQLHRWSLELTSLDGEPNVATTTAVGGAGGAIPNPGELSPTATASSAANYVIDVDLRSDISHLATGDLTLTLTSPANTNSTISSGNGASFDNVFGDGPAGAPGTLFSDQAGAVTADTGGGPVTDAEFVDGVVETDLVPEEAMGAFIGENPNGAWTFEVSDGFAGGFGGDSGSLNSWSLSVATIAGCAVTPGNTPPIADAGGPYAIQHGSPLTLDGTGSSDPDSNPITWSWDVNGDGTFGDATGATPTLSAAQLAALGVGPGVHQVRVRVSDGVAGTVSPTTTLTVTLLGGGGGGGAGNPQSPYLGGQLLAPGGCANLLNGTAKRDRLTGTAAGDRINGKAGPDVIRGLAGDDCIKGGPGRDRIKAGVGDDSIKVRGGGRDRVNCGPGTDSVFAGRTDRLSGCESVKFRGRR